MKIQILPFAYDQELSNFLSEKSYNEHLKLYKGYVDKTNAITNDLRGDAGRGDANKTYSLYRGLKKGESFALNGVILHELYFKNIGADGGGIGGGFRALAEKDFGTFENWATDFVATAKSARGWCVAAFEQRSRRLCNILMDAHDEGFIASAYPLIVLDVYEHAYYLDYATDAAKYIAEFMGHINWKAVEERVARL